MTYIESIESACDKYAGGNFKEKASEMYKEFIGKTDWPYSTDIREGVFWDVVKKTYKLKWDFSSQL